MAPEDDWSLVRRVVEAGDLTAFDVLVERHQDRIYGVVARMVSNVETAQDLTQDTFLNAFKGLKSFSGGSSFFTWLYRIARNVVTSHARWEAARPRVRASLDGGEQDDDGVALRLQPESRDPDPVKVAVESERKKLLLAALAALPADFREIIVLRDFEDRPYDEIADLLDIPPGTVRSRLHRARTELRERLKPILDDVRTRRP